MANAVPTELLEKKIAHLDGLIADCDRTLAATPKLGWLGILALPAGFFRGFFGFGATLVSVLSLIAVVYYIVGVRRKDYALERAELARDVARASLA